MIASAGFKESGKKKIVNFTGMCILLFYFQHDSDLNHDTTPKPAGLTY